MMKKHKIPNIIFASSATVYKNDTCEDAALEAINPYGQNKILAE
jgi:UDP-glucose 4-epimerase